ncbi:hypothetical protein [Tenacibaculum sp. 47A_GOM-205m]|uniref:hypothetical protein n=1 Tax=Tenacibaculum sp. 47A_GOM-205m TaxID=1380384 RepID=UPI000688D02F|nr:hypothetical protein [Tenacibaculum sp. 47A_GOM-205m]
MTHKEKILEFVGTTGLNKTQFCKKCGLSNGYLDTKGAITTDKLVSILENFRMLNLKWLLFDEGEMILSSEKKDMVNEEPSTYKLEKTKNDLEIFALNAKLEALKKEFDLLKDNMFQIVEDKLNEAINNKEI